MLDTSSHTINALFDQLGLPSSDEEIENFIETHQLKDTRLINAEFWTKHQKQFIDQEWRQDSVWVSAIDELNARLEG